MSRGMARYSGLLWSHTQMFEMLKFGILAQFVQNPGMAH
jgi:hypothetical protein